MLSSVLMARNGCVLLICCSCSVHLPHQARLAMSLLTANAWCSVAAHTAKIIMFQTTKNMDIPSIAAALRDRLGAPGYEDSMFCILSGDDATARASS